MKPSWDDAPSWAKWLAMDDDGLWYWYGGKPHLTWYMWAYEQDDNYVKAGRSGDVARWKESLEERPDAE